MLINKSVVYTVSISEMSVLLSLCKGRSGDANGCVKQKLRAYSSPSNGTNFLKMYFNIFISKYHSSSSSANILNCIES